MKKTLFESKNTLNQSDFKKMQRFFVFTVCRKRFFRAVIFVVLSIAAGFAMNVIFSDAKGWVMSAFIICIILIRELRPILRENAENKCKFGKESICRFHPASWTNIFDGKEFSHKYSGTKVWEMSDRFYREYKNTVFVVAKDSFSEGNAEEFSAFISRKLGKNFITKK